MQQEMQSEYPLLYSLAGHRYCDLLLESPEPVVGRSHDRPTELTEGLLDHEGRPAVAAVDGEGDPSTTEPADESSEQAIARIREVRNRAEKWFEWRGEDDSMFDTGLAHLMLGRTYLAEAELQTEPTAPGADVDGESDETANSELSAFGSLRQAEQHLNQSVSLLRQSGTQHHLPRGLLHLAALWREAILASGGREPTDDSTFDSPSTDRKKNQGTDVPARVRNCSRSPNVVRC
jgi:hypothetical protein